MFKSRKCGLLRLPDLEIGFTANVIGQQRMLTPPRHLIPPLVFPGIHVCPILYFTRDLWDWSLIVIVPFHAFDRTMLENGKTHPNRTQKTLDLKSHHISTSWSIASYIPKTKHKTTTLQICSYAVSSIGPHVLLYYNTILSTLVLTAQFTLFTRSRYMCRAHGGYD
jgi:hypothetical protein